MQTVHVVISWLGIFVLGLFSPGLLRAWYPPGEKPALGDNRITQATIVSGGLSRRELRRAGLMIFATPFNKLDGHGDGPFDEIDPIPPGGRPTLQGNGTLLRINGLDAQTCVECHSLLSTATVPFTFGLGGVGGANNNAIFQPTHLDTEAAGKMNFNGRLINPPFLLGAGGIELLAKEMTADLHALKARAEHNSGTAVALITKGVSFGTILYRDGEFVSDVEGIEPDLVVRPFGRKGEFPTVRSFDVEAMPFHFGMEPVELVGEDVDADGDGVVNEVLIGELSALSIFITSLKRPETAHYINIKEGKTSFEDEGKTSFEDIGCASCHIPELQTKSPYLPLSFPEEPPDPSANVYVKIDLREANFEAAKNGGIRVPLFADLKRHFMGDDLAESFDSRLDGHFTTARLWGVADSAPYLHDGRALTLTDAILMHGGEAQAARDEFDSLTPEEKKEILRFLRSLRTPASVNTDLQ